MKTDLSQPNPVGRRVRTMSSLLVGTAAMLSCSPHPATPISTPPNLAAPEARASAVPVSAPRPLSAAEANIVAFVDQHQDEAVTLLERVVNINSGTFSFEGVRNVGAVFAEEFKALGFETRWIPMDEAKRAGHFFAERVGTHGKRVLLIGHLDTVFERDNPFQRFERISPTVCKGPGVVDMKGGDITILYALKALHAAGALEGTRIVVAFTGDEENAGDPVALARKDLLDVARRSDVALEFEQGMNGPNSATVARRGSTSWTLRVQGKPGHSSGIFSDEAGAGAVYEAARILHSFYNDLRGEKNLTFNVGVILGGNMVDEKQGQASGKPNIIPQSATVRGDLRTLTEEQLARTKARMQAIVAKNLPHTSAQIEFEEGYPPMAPKEGNWAVLRELEGVGWDLGLGPIDVIDPGKRGAADISFVAPIVASLAGLGPVGDGAHAPGETLNLASLPIATKRAALLIHRLTRE